MQSFYDLVATEINGNPFPFAQLRNKKVMIVNTASECGFTPQYAQLQELYEEFASSDFVVIGFPSNDFGQQEPGTHEEIKLFCTQNFNVTFPLMQKVKVTGSEMCDVYKYLTQKTNNGVADVEIKWNFQKILIDENGQLVKSISAATDANSYEIITWLTQPKLF
jgi:glutathione peroxidase